MGDIQTSISLMKMLVPFAYSNFLPFGSALIIVGLPLVVFGELAYIASEINIVNPECIFKLAQSKEPSSVFLWIQPKLLEALAVGSKAGLKKLTINLQLPSKHKHWNVLI